MNMLRNTINEIIAAAKHLVFVQGSSDYSEEEKASAFSSLEALCAPAGKPHPLLADFPIADNKEEPTTSEERLTKALKGLIENTPLVHMKDRAFRKHWAFAKNVLNDPTGKPNGWLIKRRGNEWALYISGEIEGYYDSEAQAIDVRNEYNAWAKGER